MASKVNVKFVAALASVLVLLAGGVAFLAATVLFKSGEDHAAAGRELAAAGQYAVADQSWRKAVADDPWNREWLLGWRETMHNITPATRSELEGKFQRDYLPVHFQLAKSDPEGLEAQREYLDIRLRLLELEGYQRDDWESLANDARLFWEHYAAVRPEDTAWQWLKRYQAMALARGVDAGQEPTEREVAEAIAAAQAALASDPRDQESANAIITLKLRDARLARDRRRDDVAAALEQEVLDLASLMVERAAPGAGKARAILSEVSAQRMVGMDRIRRGVSPGQLVEAVRAADVALVARLDEASAELASDPAGAAADPGVLRVLFSMEAMLDPGANLRRTLARIEDALGAKPGDVRLTWMKPTALRLAGDLEGALDGLQAVRDRPPLPIGVDGYELQRQQLEALVTQADLTASLAVDSSGAERERWLERASAFREQLSAAVPGEHPALLRTDAMLAIARGNMHDAQRLLARFNEVSEFRDERMLWLAGRTAASLNQPGIARDMFARALVASPTSLRAMIGQAGTEEAVGNDEDALRLYARVLELDPGNVPARERVAALNFRLGRGEATDPVQRALVEADKLATGAEGLADMAAAIALLTQAAEENGLHPRLVTEVSRLLTLEDRIPEALDLLRRARAQHPDDEVLPRFESALTADNRTDALARLIDDADVPPLDKALRKFTLYRALNDQAAADAALAEAARLDPNSSVVIEYQFVSALTGKRLDEAEAIAQRAEAANSDMVNGETYRARLLATQGKFEEATQVYTRALDQQPNNASLHRMLAGSYVAMGRDDLAYPAFRRALEIRPNDVVTIVPAIQSMVRLERYEEALQLARASERVAKANVDFREMLLSLESRLGNKERALALREELYRREPKNPRNLSELARMLTEASQFDRARRLIEELRAVTGPTDRLVMLDALWYAHQNQLERAGDTFTLYIAQKPPEERVGAYLLYAEFLAQRGRPDLSIKALEQATTFQDPKLREADRALGDAYLASGRASAAVDAYKRVLAAGADTPERDYAKRLAEALVRTKRPAEARELLAGLDADDFQVSLLRAEVELLDGDRASALEAIESVVAKWPDQPIAYIKRAEAMRGVPELLRDRLVDLDKALELSPSYWQAYLARSRVLGELGDTARQVEDLTQAVRLNPQLDDARLELIRTLLLATRVADATRVGEDALRARPGDVELRFRLAELFRAADQPNEAVRYYRDALRIDPTPLLAVRVLQLMLSEERPQLAAAEEIFAIKQIQEQVESDGGLLLMRARMFQRLGRDDAARRDLTAAFRVLERDTGRILIWLDAVKSMFPERATLLTYIDALGREPNGAEWSRLFRARLAAEEEASRSQGKEQLRSLAMSSADPSVAHLAWSELGQFEYADERFEEARDAWQRAYDLRSDRWIVANNLAFVLSRHLGRHVEAMPLAQLAAAQAPFSADAQETLGGVLLAMGQGQGAMEQFERAIALGQNEGRVGVSAAVGLARARLMIGDELGARDLAGQLMEAVRMEGVELTNYQRADLEKLQRDLDLE